MQDRPTEAKASKVDEFETLKSFLFPDLFNRGLLRNFNSGDQ